MKKLLALLCLLLALPASGQSILRQFGTTNSPTALTNIIISLAGAAGGATNGILKLDGLGTNTTFYKSVGTFNITLAEPVGEGATARVGDFYLEADGDTFSLVNLAGPTTAFDFNLLTDIFTIQEILLVQEELRVTTGQDGPAITQSGGGTNYFDASTYFASNVYARALSISNATASRIAIFNAAKELTNGIVGSGLSFDGITLTATGGSGDTNAISYLPDLVNAAKTRNLANGVPVFDVARWTNGVNAISITNTGTDTDSFGIKDSTGGDRFRFTSGINLMTVNSGGPFQLHVDETTIVEDYQTGIRRLHDANGDLAIDFSDAADVQMNTLAPTTVNASTVNLLEGGRIALDAALSADGTYSATVTRAGTAGATLAFGDLIVLDPTDSRWELADANSASGADGDARGMIGICILAAAADGDPTVVLLQGVVRADAVFPSFTVNAPVYVSETAGDITGTLPTTEDNVVRRLGSATTADEIYFNPGDWSTYDVP